MKKIAFLFIAFLISTQSFGQINGEDELGSWYMYSGLNRISEKWSLHTEAQLRMYKKISGFNQFLPRIGVNYHINETSMVSAGYALIPTESFEKGDLLRYSIENRVWEQLILKNKLGRLNFEHRYRLEQRWLAFDNGSTAYKNRIRYRIMLAVPLNNPELVDNTLYLAAYDEIFMHIEDDPFDQNRLYFALGYKANRIWNFQAGYLRHNVRSLTYNRLQFAAIINTDFRKKQ